MHAYFTSREFTHSASFVGSIVKSVLIVTSRECTSARQQITDAGLHTRHSNYILQEGDLRKPTAELCFPSKDKGYRRDLLESAGKSRHASCYGQKAGRPSQVA